MEEKPQGLEYVHAIRIEFKNWCQPLVPALVRNWTHL